MSIGEPIEHERLREGDLLAFLEGVAPPERAAHIAGCARCQAELAGLRAAEAMLMAALARADCPEAATLLRYQAGLLDAAEAAGVAAHAVSCADCQGELALLAAPPEPGLAGRLARAGLRLVRAALQPAAAPAFALRGETPAPRRAHFAAEGYQVVVAVAPLAGARGRYQVEGQLLGPGGPVAGTATLAGGAAEQAAEVDELGFFAFDGVAPGAYTLALTLAEAQVIAEPLEVP